MTENLIDQQRDRAATGQVVSEAAQVYEDFFVPALFGQWPPHVLRSAGLRPGDAVLDVGCGTGVLAREAARCLAGSGRVVGVDVNPGMLAVARRTDDRVTWVEAPAASLPFDDGSFDVVASQFVLMFVPEPEAALREMARVCRPGGSVTVATWADVEDSPGYAAMIQVLDRVLGHEAADALRAPFTLGSEEVLRALVAHELPDVEVHRLPGTARFASLEAWLHTDVRGWTLAGSVDDEQYAELLAAARHDLADFVGTDGQVAFGAPALVASARTPAG